MGGWFKFAGIHRCIRIADSIAHNIEQLINYIAHN